MSVARVREIATRMRRRGFRVVFEPGWERRGNGMSPAYRGDIVHHTATGFANQNLNVLIRGRSDLPGPLCNFCTWSNGTIGVIAAFPANHAGASGGRNMGPLPTTRSFNKYVLGNEIIYPGTQPMTPAQYRSATALSAVINQVLGYGDAGHTRAHAETSITGKWDPGRGNGVTYDMNAFRTAVRGAMRGDQGGRGGNNAPGGDTMSKDDALAALREYFNSEWHEPPQAGDQPNVSLRDELLRTGTRTYQLNNKEHENSAGNKFTLPTYVVNTNDRLVTLEEKVDALLAALSEKGDPQ